MATTLVCRTIQSSQNGIILENEGKALQFLGALRALSWAKVNMRRQMGHHITGTLSYSSLSIKAIKASQLSAA